METLVYVIESSDFLARTLKRMLLKLDVESVIVQSIKNLEKELSINQAEKTIALTSLVLDDAPDGDVLDVLNDANIPTIVMSANYCPENRKFILSYQNVIDYLIKNNDTYNIATKLVKRLVTNQKLSAVVCDPRDNILAKKARLLSLLQFKVYTAKTKEEALSIVNEDPKVILVLISSLFPEDKAYKLTSELREINQNSELGIIGICEQDTLDAPTKFIKYGANDFVKKPFMQEELIMRCLQTIYILETVAQLHKDANYDFLTNLMNRRCFFKKAEKFLKNNKGKGPMAFAMFDIDHFKQINDKYGHDAGDAVLSFFARLAKMIFPEKKMSLARLGGEEFALLLHEPYTKECEFVGLLESFRAALESSTIEFEHQELRVTTSIGCIIDTFDSLATYMKKADDLLYEAKENGRNQLKLHAPKD